MNLDLLVSWYENICLDSNLLHIESASINIKFLKSAGQHLDVQGAFQRFPDSLTDLDPIPFLPTL